MTGKGIALRVVATLFAVLLYGWLNAILTPVGTVEAGAAAGNQFGGGDVGYVGTFIALRFFAGFGPPFWLFLVLLLVIWWRPAMAWIAALIGAFLLVFPVPSYAYYDKTDFTEAYTILPNESAFWIPDVGANKDTQAQFETEAYLNANRVALKRFIVPHTKLSGSGSFFDFYVPAGRLIIVDRTPYSREWVDATDRGTAKRKEGFPCQSSEGINITVGISIGASVREENAAKYLYRFGVLAPPGDRKDPAVIFTSVYFSRKLSDVMDDVGRKAVQTMVCAEITARNFDKANNEANLIIDSVRKKAMDYFASVGITVDFIGWADTFTFDNNVQDAVNRRYIATQDQAIASALAPYAQTIQALAAAEALRAFGAKSDGKLPTTIVGLPTDLGGLLGQLLQSGAPAVRPAAAAK